MPLERSNGASSLLPTWEIRQGDALERLREMDAGSVQCCVTSPPYFGLRDYGSAGQIGLEPTPAEFVASLVGVFREVRRVLRDDGTFWLNMGDSYNNRAVSRPSSHQAGLGFDSQHLSTSWAEHAANGRAHLSITDGDLKEKDLLMIPAQLALALRADGWYLRSDIIWAKPNPMPESVTDRPTSSHEHIFLLSKSPRYFYDADAIREDDGGKPSGNSFITTTTGEPRLGHRLSGGLAKGGSDEPWEPGGGRNKRNVWSVATHPYAGAHFATFPPKLIEPCVLAGSAPTACGECGSPWTRRIEIESRPNWVGNGKQKHDGTHYRENIGGGVGNDRRERRDHGWVPTCAHTDNTGISVVLDPFAGSGTTGMVALRHGRSFIGLELNPEYVEIARRRICDDAPLMNTIAEAA